MIRLIIFIFLIQFSFVSLAQQQEPLLPIRQNYKWGAINSKAQIIIPPVYNFIGDFSPQNYAIAQKDQKLGLINANGQAIIPFQFKNLRILSPDLVAFAQEKWGIWHIHKGKMMDTSYDDIIACGPKATSLNNKTTAFIILKQAKKWFALSPDGQSISTQSYDSLSWLPPRFIQTFKAQKTGLLNYQYQEVLPAIYDYFGLNPYTGLIWVTSNQKTGLFDFQGKQIIPTDYEAINIKYIQQKEYFEVVKNQKKGLYDQQGNLVVSPEYDAITLNPNGNFITAKGQKQGLLNSQGQEIIPHKYDYINQLSAEHALVFQKSKAGVYQISKSDLMIPMVYSSIKHLVNKNTQKTYFLVKNGEQIGLLDAKGNTLLALESYQHIVFDKEGIFRVKANDLWGLYAKNTFYSPRFDQISNFKNKLAKVKKGKLYGLINIHAELLAPSHLSKDCNERKYCPIIYI